MRISDWSSDVCSSDLSEGRCLSDAQRFAHGPGVHPAIDVVKVVADLYFAILQLHRIVCAGLDAALGAFGVRHVLQQDFRDARDIEFLLQLFPPGQWLGYMKLGFPPRAIDADRPRSEEHTSELQSLMRISYAVFCLKKKKKHTINRQSKTKLHMIHAQRST